MFIKVKIRNHERGFLFKSKEFVRMLSPGEHWLFDPFLNYRVDKLDIRKPLIRHDDLDLILKTDALAEVADVIDLKDHERALVWVDGRFKMILPPAKWAFWNIFSEIKIDIVEVLNVRFDHWEIANILKWNGAKEFLDTHLIESGHEGLLFVDGKFIETLKPGRFAFWKTGVKVRIENFDKRELVLDVSGQDIMTKDNVTLRLNALVNFRVVDPLKNANATDDYRQTLYRDTQLVLRSIVGTFDLETLLSEKDSIDSELIEQLEVRVAQIGIEILAFGIRDIILPGEMKQLLNKVTEAKKAAEANLITRREETAGIRSQANTAKIIEANPTLMRLRELEALEKIADKTNLTVVLGEQGLVDKISKMV